MSLQEFKEQQKPPCAICKMPKDIREQVTAAQKQRSVGSPTIHKWLVSIGREVSESAVRRHGAHA